MTCLASTTPLFKQTDQVVFVCGFSRKFRVHFLKGIKRNENCDTSTNGDEEHTPLWYIMDEFGSYIKHSDDPSFAVAMLFYVPLGVSFSIMWPLRDMAYGGLYKNT